MNESPSLRCKVKQSRGSFVVNVDTTISTQGITALFGSSGSGKTTLLRVIAGLEKTTNSEIVFNGKTWQNAGSIFIPAHLREIGYVFQEANLFPHLTVESNLAYGFKRQKNERAVVRYQDVVELLNLNDFLTRSPQHLSGGQKQRVAIGRALLSQPQLLLMDEPLASLDEASKQEIIPYLEKIHETINIPIIYVSHSVEEIARIADQIVLIDKGAVLAQGEINEMLTREDLPLAHLNEACAVINGWVDSHDDDHHLSYVSVGDYKLAVSKTTRPINSDVRIRIIARDVSLALEKNFNSTIHNIFPATINKISSSYYPGKLIVQLDTGQFTILSQITKLSSKRLKLKTGQTVWAQVKSAALMR